MNITGISLSKEIKSLFRDGLVVSVSASHAVGSHHGWVIPKIIKIVQTASLLGTQRLTLVK